MLASFAGASLTRVAKCLQAADTHRRSVLSCSSLSPVQAQLTQLSEAVHHAPRRAYLEKAESQQGGPRVCRLCKSKGHIPCSACGGKGRLEPGGHHKRNPLNISRIVGSKWTARHRTFGRTHFFVQKLHKIKETKSNYVLMVAACGTKNEVQLWINAQNLKLRELWSAGWLQRTERLALAEGGPPCNSCRGSGALLCRLCEHRGGVVEL